MSGADQCQRCGVATPALFTLQQNAEYPLDETGLPFGLEQLRGGRHLYSHDQPDPSDRHGLQLQQTTFEPQPADARPRVFYALRVCAQRRAEWLRVLRDWFLYPPAPGEPECPDGHVAVQDFGAVQFIPYDDWLLRRQ